MRNNNFGSVLGAITRYGLAAVALVSLAQFLLLINVGTEKANELAGETGGRAIVCGVIAAVWFYRHRRTQQLNQAVEKFLQAPRPAEQLKAEVPSLSAGSPRPVSPSLVEPPQPEAKPLTNEANVHAAEARNTGTLDSAGANRFRADAQRVPEFVAKPDGANAVNILAILVGSAFLLLFGWFVWPTQYRYDTLGTAHIPVRTNRFTGETERLTQQGWIKPAPPVDNPFDQIFGRDAAPRGTPDAPAPSGGNIFEQRAKEMQHPTEPQAVPQNQPEGHPFLRSLEKLAPKPTANPVDEVLAATDTISKCPSELPAGTKAMRFPPAELKLVDGTKAHLGLKDGYWVEWVMLHFSNGSKHCITLVEVELTLQYGNSSFKQRHTVSFNPILGPGQESDTDIKLHEQGPEKNGEPLSMQEWHVTSAWGFNYPTLQSQNSITTGTPALTSKGGDNNPPAQQAKGSIDSAHEPWVTDELTEFDSSTGMLKTGSGRTCDVIDAKDRALVRAWRVRAIVVKSGHAEFNSIGIRVGCKTGTQIDCIVQDVENNEEVHPCVFQLP